MKNTENILKKYNNIDWLKSILYLILASPALFFLVNKFPYFLIISIGIVVLVAFIFFIFKRQITSYHYLPLLFLTLLYIFLIFSYFFSGQSLTNFMSYSFLRTDGNFFFCYVLFFALSIPYFNYERITDYYFKFIFITFTVFAAIGIVEYLIGHTGFMLGVDPSQAGEMFLGLNNTHNATGSVYALTSVFGLVFFLKESQRKLKVLYFIILALNVAGLFLTKSRGGYLAFAATVVFVLWMHFKSVKKFFISLSILIIAFIPILWITQAYKRLIQIFQVEGTTVTRIELWKKAWDLFTESPLLGIGFGRFNDIQSMLFEKTTGWNGIFSLFIYPNFYYDFSHAHNAYLQFLAETGLVGLGILLIFWLLCFRIIFKAFLSIKKYQLKKILLCGLAAIVNLFVLSLTENYFSATTIMIPTSMIVALCIGIFWQENRNQEVKNKVIIV